MTVLVVIADIVRSRIIDDRATFQRGLKRTLDGATAAAGERLLSPYTLTLGDEFQAVYRSGHHVLRDVVDLMARVAPVQLRVAIAYGELTTDVNHEAALEMDGPVFAAARATMQHLKRSPRASIRIAAKTLGNIGLVNAALAVLASTIAAWHVNTLRTLAARAHGRTSDEIARALGISRRAVNKQIATHAIQDFSRLVDEIDASLASGLPPEEVTEL